MSDATSQEQPPEQVPGQPRDKRPVGFSLSAEARRLLQALKTEHGVSKTAIIEMAIREKAKRDGVESKSKMDKRVSGKPQNRGKGKEVQERGA